MRLNNTFRSRIIPSGVEEDLDPGGTFIDFTCSPEDRHVIFDLLGVYRKRDGRAGIKVVWEGGG